MTYHAKTTYARLEIFVPYPEKIVADNKARNDAALAALAGFPEYAVTLIRVKDSDEATAFSEAIDFNEVRVELRRKAKKLGFELPKDNFAVEFLLEERGVLIHASLRRCAHD